MLTIDEIPEPTLRAVQACIPRAYKQISASKSLRSLAFSLTTTAALVAVGIYLWPEPTFSSVFTVLLWLPLSLSIGMTASGLWVLGHECGHGTFIRPVWLEQTIGLLLHTFFLAPYVSWRRTHQMHHQRTNHVAEDIAYVPFPANSLMARFQRTLRRLFGTTCFNVIFQSSVFLVGFPVYLAVGLPGKMAWVSHLLPLDRAVFPTRSFRLKVWLNSALLLCWLAVVAWWTFKDPAWMIFFYVLPLLVVNFWLLFYTLHHHASAAVPWYDSISWTPLRGAFAAIDRPYWPLINLLHHNIGRFHIYHHVCSSVPHYYGEAVTRLLKERYPQLFVEDPVNPFRRAWQLGASGLTVERQEHHRYWLAAEAAAMVPQTNV